MEENTLIHKNQKIKGQIPNSELFSQAWRDLKGKWGISISLCLLYLVFSVIGLIGGIFITVPLNVGSAIFWINISRKTNPQINDMFKGFNSYGAALKAKTIVGLIVIGGMILLIIPGIIWGIQYSMVNYIIADDSNCGGNESLVRSRKMMYGHKWKMFEFMLRAIGIILLCFLTLGIGLLWGIPWISTAMAKFYDDIK